jgi:hypothetical protein
VGQQIFCLPSLLFLFLYPGSEIRDPRSGIREPRSRIRGRYGQKLGSATLASGLSKRIQAILSISGNPDRYRKKGRKSSLYITVTKGFRKHMYVAFDFCIIFKNLNLWKVVIVLIKLKRKKCLILITNLLKRLKPKPFFLIHFLNKMYAEHQDSNPSPDSTTQMKIVHTDPQSWINSSLLHVVPLQAIFFR